MDDDFAEKLVKLIPRVKVGRAFDVSEADSKNGVVKLVFSAVRQQEHPPYLVQALREGSQIKDVLISFALPEKVPRNAGGWLPYFFINDRDPKNVLAHVINDGERWGIDRNRFTRDGLQGPPDSLVRELAHAVARSRQKTLSPKEKKLAVQALLQASKLVEKDAAGMFAFEAVLPFSPPAVR